MKTFLLLLFLSVGAYAACRPSDLISTLRPGAEWKIADDDVSTLVWLSTQTIPTKAEVLTAISACQVTEVNRKTLKQQARLDVKNTGLTPVQRLQALLILLDYDQ